MDSEYCKHALSLAVGILSNLLLWWTQAIIAGRRPVQVYCFNTQRSSEEVFCSSHSPQPRVVGWNLHPMCEPRAIVHSRWSWFSGILFLLHAADRFFMNATLGYYWRFIVQSSKSSSASYQCFYERPCRKFSRNHPPATDLRRRTM
jgi:hypothetical protein